MNEDFSIVIAGGGIVGLSVAALLTEIDGLKVTVLDSGARPHFDVSDEVGLRVSSIAPGSIDILSAIGAWEEIVGSGACPFRDMRVWDAFGSVDGPETLTFDSAEFAIPQLGFIVENHLVQHAILNVLDATDALVRYETPITSMVRMGERFEVTLDSGDTITPDLLIGADGAGSFVRNNTGIAFRSIPHAQKAFVTLLRPEKSHSNTAWQRFLRRGPIGLLPLTDGRISIVWSTTSEEADEALALPADELGKLLTAITDGVLGFLTPAGPRGVFPLKTQYAARYTQDGLVLIGDAAHSIHPLAGQGVNLGFADAAALSTVISAALAADENPGDLPVLRRYERARKGDNQRTLQFMVVLNRLFSNDSRALGRLRGAGMYLFNRSGMLRERIVQTALRIR